MYDSRDRGPIWVGWGFGRKYILGRSGSGLNDRDSPPGRAIRNWAYDYVARRYRTQNGNTTWRFVVVIMPDLGLHLRTC
jgi:hypothetical protein